jgi:hypothetical protein
MQSLNKSKMNKDKFEELLQSGLQHLRFCVKLYKIQMDNGLHFLHEHPATAKSWEDPIVERIMKDWRVYGVKGDMCRFGMQQKDENGEGHVKKRTMFMTNAEMSAGKLAQKCVGGHRHVNLINGRTKKATNHLEDLCKEIIRGLRDQMED